MKNKIISLTNGHLWTLLRVIFENHKKKKNSKGAKIAMMADAKTPLTTTAIDKRNNAQGRIYEDIIGLHSKYIVVN